MRPSRLCSSPKTTAEDAVHLEQGVLDLDRVDLLSSDVDDLGLPAEDAHVLALDLDAVTVLNQPSSVNRLGVQVAEHRRAGLDLEEAVDDGLEALPADLHEQGVVRPGLRA